MSTFTDEDRNRLVRKYRRMTRAMLAGAALSIVGSIGSVVVLGDYYDGNRISGWLLVTFTLFSIGTALTGSQMDDYKYGLSVPDLDKRLNEVEGRSRHAVDRARAAHGRIAQIERMSQQGRVIIPDTLNVHLTNDREAE